jgi:hypothetical protein
MDQNKVLLTFALCLAALLAPACSQAPGVGQGQSGPDATPDQVMAAFLEAVRAGDDGKAAGLLTPLARQKTAEMEMVVAPPGSETAKFEVLESEVIGAEAQVATDWTDLDTDGRPHTDRIVWMMRKVDDGWRISGMATRVFIDRPPIVLNFEDPADMLQKQQQAEEEIARRDQQSPATANPAAPGDSKVR